MEIFNSKSWRETKKYALSTLLAVGMLGCSAEKPTKPYQPAHTTIPHADKSRFLPREPNSLDLFYMAIATDPQNLNEGNIIVNYPPGSLNSLEDLNYRSLYGKTATSNITIITERKGASFSVTGTIIDSRTADSSSFYFDREINGDSSHLLNARFRNTFFVRVTFDNIEIKLTRISNQEGK